MALIDGCLRSVLEHVGADACFPQGLEAHDPEHLRSLRLAYEEWEENKNGLRPNPAIHRAWIRFVLRETLGFPQAVIAEGQSIPQTLKAIVPEHGETIRPDLIITNPGETPNAGQPRLMVQTLAPDQDLDKRLPDRRWKASPDTRAMELLHATECRLGLVTNGERWMLVDAPRGETTGFSSWYASIWLEEHIPLEACSLRLGFSLCRTARRWRQCSQRAPRTSRRSRTSSAIRYAGR